MVRKVGTRCISINSQSIKGEEVRGGGGICKGKRREVFQYGYGRKSC